MSGDPHGGDSAGCDPAAAFTAMATNAALAATAVPATSAPSACAAATHTDRSDRRRRLALRAQLRSSAVELGAASPRDPPGATPAFNERESPLAWLARRRDREGRPLISQAQYDAGERLRLDLYLAQLTPRTTQSWSGIAQSRRGRRAAPGVGVEITDRRVAALARVGRALTAVGPELSGILVDVCGHLKGLEDIERAERWPQRSAKLVLDKALLALARHYGLLEAEPVEALVARRLRHWGAPDYRPTLDGWRGSASGLEDRADRRGEPDVA